MNKKNNRTLFGLLKETGLTKHRASLILSFTNQRSDSAADLTDAEANEMIIFLRKKKDASADKGNKMRRNILAMAHEMHWELESGKVDIERVNKWCREYGYMKKNLNDYSYEELPKLVHQFKMVYNSFLNSI